MRARRVGRVWVVGLLILAAACATSGGSGGGRSGPVTRAMLMDTGHRNLTDALRSLRPTWLRARGATRLNGEAVEVTLYVNGAYYGTVANLSSIPLNTVVEVDYMSPADATTRFGTTAGSGGLVLVRTGN